MFLNEFLYVFRIYEFGTASFVIAAGLALQATLEKAKVKQDLLTDINMFLMVEKGIGGRICHAIHRY